MYEPEVCTAPKNRGGGGAEADVNYNSVAERPRRLKPFQVAERPLRASFLMGRGAGAPPGGRLIVSGEIFSCFLFEVYCTTITYFSGR